jgi:glycine cleavage system regulatory protein
VTQHVVEAGGNVGESQAAKLGHHFSLMMLLTVPADKADSFKEQMYGIRGINTSIFETTASPDAAAKPVVGYAGLVTLEGANQPGIVHNVTAILAQNGMSIDKLKTGEDIAPHGGTTLFHMQCMANALEPLSKDFSPEKVRDQLAALGESLNCDVDLEDVQDESAGARFFSG